MLLPITRGRFAQPQDRSEISRHPLTRGLFIAVDCRTGKEMVSGRSMTRVSSPATVVTRSGVGVRTDGSASYLTIDIPSKSLSAGTIAWLGRATGTPGLDTRVFALASSATNDPLLMINVSATNASKMRTFWRDNAGNFPVTLPDTTATAFSTGAPVMNVVRVSNTSGANQGVLDAFVNGVYDVSSSAFTAGGLTVNRVGVGCLARATAGSFFAGDSVLCLAWDRALSDVEIAELTRNPWVVFSRRGELIPLADGVISAAINEAFSLTDSASFPPTPFIPLLRPPRRLARPSLRTGAVLRGADRDPTWQLSGTTGNFVRKPGGTEGGSVELQGSVAAMQVSSTPVSALNFTVLARIRFDTSPSGNAFGIGNAGNANQHYLSISSSGPTMTFVVYGFNGSTNTNAFSDPVSFTTGRFYNLAITSRPGRIEIWLDGVRVASTANSMVSEVHTMTHTVLGGVMNAGSPAASTLASSIAAFVTLPGTVVSDNRLREITADPRGIHKMFERRAETFMLPQIIGATYNDEVSEAVILSETPAATNATTSAQSESTALTDSQASTMSATAAGSEALALVDSQAATAVFAVTMPEALALADGQAVTATLLGAAGEALALSDVPAAILEAVAAIAEPLALTDTQNGFSGEAQVSESLALVDARDAAAQLQATRSESLALTEAVGNTAVRAAAQSESIALAEAAAAVAALLAQHIESLGLTDQVAVGATTVTATLSEALALAAACNGVVMTINVGGVDATFYVVMEDNTVMVQMEDATISVLAENATVLVA